MRLIVRRLEQRLRAVERPPRPRRGNPFRHVPSDELAKGRAILERAILTGDHKKYIGEMKLEAPTVYAAMMQTSDVPT